MAVGKERHSRNNKKKKTSENNGWALTTRKLSVTDFSRGAK
jgi:ribosomal protein L32